MLYRPNRHFGRLFKPGQAVGALSSPSDESSGNGGGGGAAATLQSIAVSPSPAVIFGT